MLFLFLEKALRNEQRKVSIPVPRFLKAPVHLLLDMLPDLKSIRFEHDTAADRRVVHEVRFLDYIDIPPREVFALRRNLRNKLLVFSHIMVFLLLISLAREFAGQGRSNISR
ncbi:hypothetical protein D3C71_1595170 [compost metagenome]